MERDIKSIIIILATQSMINLGEIKNPVTKDINVNLEGGLLFLELLEVLKKKTIGNLDQEEDSFLNEAIENLKHVYKNKAI